MTGLKEMADRCNWVKKDFFLKASGWAEGRTGTGTDLRPVGEYASG